MTYDASELDNLTNHKQNLVSQSENDYVPISSKENDYFPISSKENAVILRTARYFDGEDITCVDRTCQVEEMEGKQLRCSVMSDISPPNETDINDVQDEMNGMSTDSSTYEHEKPTIVRTMLRTSSVVSDVTCPKYTGANELSDEHSMTSESVALAHAISKSPATVQTVLKNSQWLDAILKTELRKENKLVNNDTTCEELSNNEDKESEKMLQHHIKELTNRIENMSKYCSEYNSLLEEFTKVQERCAHLESHVRKVEDELENSRFLANKSAHDEAYMRDLEKEVSTLRSTLNDERSQKDTKSSVYSVKQLEEQIKELKLESAQRRSNEDWYKLRVKELEDEVRKLRIESLHKCKIDNFKIHGRTQSAQDLGKSSRLGDLMTSMSSGINKVANSTLEETSKVFRRLSLSRRSKKC